MKKSILFTLLFAVSILFNSCMIADAVMPDDDDDDTSYTYVTVHGRVVDSVSGKAISGANVSKDYMGASVTTDSKGYFELSYTNYGGSLTLTITALGYPSKTTDLTYVSGTFHNFKDIEITPETRYTTFSGSITNNSGRPVVNASVSITHSTGIAQLYTDSSGNYSYYAQHYGSVAITVAALDSNGTQATVDATTVMFNPVVEVLETKEFSYTKNFQLTTY